MLPYSSHFNLRVLCSGSPEQVNEEINLMIKWTDQRPLLPEPSSPGEPS